MAPKAIPDRWLNYSPVGQKIKGTRFIAFKVPLKEDVVDSVKGHLRLTCESLVKEIPNLGMIIDLTNTNRYYNPGFFIKQGIRYEKLMIPGHQIPPRNLVHKFNMMAKDFLRSNNQNNKLIGVHCTHGVNRTGYLICKFMISEMDIPAKDAIKRFNAARGHQIERENYVEDLTAVVATGSPTSGQPYSNWRNNQTESSTTNSTRGGESGQPYSNWRNNQTESSTTNSTRGGESGQPYSNWRNNQTESSATNSTRGGQTYGDYRRSQASNRSSGWERNSQTNGSWRSSQQPYDQRQSQTHSRLRVETGRFPTNRHCRRTGRLRKFCTCCQIEN